jgi:hypothetical protein
VAPSPHASRIDVLEDLWKHAGLDAVETREIAVQRTFDDFEDYWSTILTGPSVSAKLASMAPHDLAVLKTRMQKLLPADAADRITYGALANAVKGHVPG